MLKLLRSGITFLIPVLFSFFCVGPVFSQNRPLTVKGVVRDANGMEMAGVTVLLKNSSVGTVTDSGGAFTISVPGRESVLVFSFMGYKPEEVPVGSRLALEVTLREEASAIEDVVVVGYGVQKKVSVTGSVSSVSASDIKKSTSASLSSALAGRISGLASTQSTGGQPGVDDAVLYLRGAGTTNVTSPLILIDGVPRDNIRTIDPNEVESISVLKDASATAVFGVRGANGVILITTRRGQEGKAKLSINATQSFATFAKRPERLHSLDYLRMRNEALTNDGKAGIDPELFAMYENPLKGLDPNDPDYAAKAANRRYLYPDIDQYRAMFKQFAPQTTVNANVSGGTKRLSYFVNVGYTYQGGHLKTEPKSKLGYDASMRMNRWSFRSNLDYKLTESLKASLNLGTYIETVGMPSYSVAGFGDPQTMTGAMFWYSSLMLPLSPGPLTLPDHGVGIPGGGFLGAYSPVTGGTYLAVSGYEYANGFGYHNRVNANLNSTFALEWDLGRLVTKGLVLRGMISYDAVSQTSTEGVKRSKNYALQVGSDGESFNYINNFTDDINMIVYKGAGTSYKINMQAILSYNRTFGRHTVGATFVAQRDHWESGGGEMPYNVVGIAARATYDYDNRYFAEFNLGYNGSEQFSPAKRFGVFPAVSVGWVVSNESWLKDNNVLTNLKLRASYGKVGNDQMNAARFMYLDQISVAGGGYLPSLGLGQRINEAIVGNTGITWETASKYNVGVDVGLFRDLSLSVDLFREDRNDILTQRNTIPAFQGITAAQLPRVNMGEVENKGIEFEVSYNKQITKDLHLSISGNFGLNRNEVKFADEIPLGEGYAYRYRKTGYSLGQEFGYLIDRSNNGGYWTKETLASTDLVYDFGTPRPGDFVYRDLNGDGHINERDMAPVGNGTVPRRTYGLSLGLSWKGLDFSVFFQGLGGFHSVYLGNMATEVGVEGSYFNWHRHAWTEERWKNGEKITYPALGTSNNTNHQRNDFFIQDKTFLRLKNMEIGYTIPAHLLRRAGISNLRVFLSGQNLVTWSRLLADHLDPEPLNPMHYPLTRMFNIGVNLSF